MRDARAGTAKANFRNSYGEEDHPKLQTLISSALGGSEQFSMRAHRPIADKLREVVCGLSANTVSPASTSLGISRSGGQDPSGGRRKRNFTLLLAELRKQLDARGKTASGKRYLLTIAAPASGLQRMEVDQTHPLLDFINLMTYDFAGEWNDTTGFNAALHPVPNHPEQASASASVEAYLKAGVPADKLVLGVPFYGRGWAGVTNANNGLFQLRNPAAAKGQRVGPTDYEHLKNDRERNAGKRHWHEQAKVPWMWNPRTRAFITYDDPESLRAKARYARDQKLGGVMFWELEHDDEESSLLDALHEGLKK